MDFLWSGLLSITWQQVVMYVVGLLLIYLAIEKNYEPALLLPMGFGAILVNLPASGVLNRLWRVPVRLTESSSGSLNPALRHRRLSRCFSLSVSEP